MKHCIAFGLSILFLSACSHASSAFVPTVTGASDLEHPAVTTTGVIAIALTIPASTQAARPRYVSPSTKSMLIDLYNATRKTLISKQSANLGAGATACRASGKNLVCNAAFVVTAGSYSVDVTLFDHAGATGNPLSALKAHPVVVKAGTRQAVSLVFGGLCKSIDAVPVPAAGISGNVTAGFSIVGARPQELTIVCQDADRNFVVGPGAPTAAIVSVPAHTTLATPPPSAPNTWTLTSTFVATNPTIGGASTIAVTATPVPNSGGATLTRKIPLTLYQPWIYVTNDQSSIDGPVAAFDEAGNLKTLSGTFQGLSSTGWIAYSPSNKLLYVDEKNGDDAMHVYDVMGNAQTVSGSFPNLNDGGQLVIDPANDRLYVPDYLGPSGSSVTEYDLQGNQQALSTLAFANMYNGGMVMAYDPVDNLLFGVNYYTQNVTGYDATGSAKYATGFSGLHSSQGAAYDTNNHLLYVGSSLENGPAGGVLAYNFLGVSASLNGSWTNIAFPEGMAYDPYDDKLYVATYPASASGEVDEYDPEGNRQTPAQGAFGGVNRPTGIAVVP